MRWRLSILWVGDKLAATVSRPLWVPRLWALHPTTGPGKDSRKIQSAGKNILRRFLTTMIRSLVTNIKRYTLGIRMMASPLRGKIGSPEFM
jgi:hypothetical protein